jgi:Histidine kinase-, DNA gyrase B-, and HSP90-like ATPase
VPSTELTHQYGNRRFELKVLGRTIELLGVQMYKHRNLAIAELVANCSDAGATEARIRVQTETLYNPETSTIVLEDNGCGMTPDEVQADYLVLGRNRRVDVAEAMEARRPAASRREMGRKGIGKLAGFGIAREMVVETWAEGAKTTFTLNLDELKADQNEVKDVDLAGIVEPATEASATGTRITLRRLKQKSPPQPELIVATLARRYSSTARGHMKMMVGQTTVGDPEVDWESEPTVEEATLDDGETIRFKAGFSRSVLGREMQGFTVYAHDKTAQAPPFFFDVESSASGQHGTKYLHAWISADFVDDSVDDDSDVVSTDRQDIDWDDRRVEALYAWGQRKTRDLLVAWASRRGKDMEDRVDGDPELKSRLAALDPTSQKEARRLLNSLAASSGGLDKWRQLADALIRAYEFRIFHDVIAELDAASADPDNLEQLLGRLSEWKVLESRAILEIIQGRVHIVEKFYQMIVNDAPETAPKKFMDNLHDLLADYPWLLNTEWQVMAEETSIGKQLRDWGHRDDPDGADTGRYDFLALAGDGVHKVIDIKRPRITVSLEELMRLIRYRQNLQKGSPRVDAVLVSGGAYEFDKDEYPQVEFLEWSVLHESVKRQYYHYIALLQGDVDNAGFSSKKRELGTTRSVLTSGSYRGQRRRDGLGEQP